MDIYLLAQEHNLRTVFNVLEKFWKSSGFTINYDKTQIYRIGSLKNMQTELVLQKQVSWTNNPIKVLRVTVSHQTDEALKLNYEILLPKVKAILTTWKARSLSLFGKIMIVNTLIASLFVHKMSVLPTIPDSIVNEIEKDIVTFYGMGASLKYQKKFFKEIKNVQEHL